jgi:CelD/BcsL family acetyltransferase involved in cellulose biosynthesis
VHAITEQPPFRDGVEGLSMNIRTFPAQDLPEELIKRWADIQQKNVELRSPFFCPEFTQAVATVRSDAFVAVIDDGEAFFPFQRSHSGFGKPIGGPVSDYQGIIAPLGYECDAKALMRACKLLVWDFDHVLAGQHVFAPWRTAETVSFALDLRDDVSVLSKDTRSRYRTKMHKLEREFGKVEIELESGNQEMLQLCLRWKSLQYRQSGLFDLFKVPWIRQLAELIATRRASNFTGVTSVLYAGGRPVALHFGMRSQRVWHYWFPVYDREFSRYSPGMLLLLEMISGAHDLGIAEIDFGKGETDYKQQLANRTVPLIEGSVEAYRFVTALRRSQGELLGFAHRSPIAQFMPTRMKKIIRQVKQRGRFA